MASEDVAIDDREARRMLDALDAGQLRKAAGEAVRKAALRVRRGVQEKVKAVAGTGRGKDYFRARGFGRLRMVKTSTGWHHTGPLYKDVKMFTYRKNRPAGMRTHVLVCVGASIIAIMESLMIADTITLNMNNESTGIAISYGRISAQVISGIGFLGAGTIFISQKKIAGLTTAASLWNVACLGLAVGMGYYIISLAGCAIVIITLALLQRLVRVNSVKHVEIKFIHRVETIAFINDYFQTIGVRVLDIDFHVENKGKYNLYTNIYTLDMQGKTTYKDIVNKLSEYANIQGIRTRNT